MARQNYRGYLAKPIVEAYKKGGKIMLADCSGLCATAEHVAAEFVGKYAFDVFIPCISLTTNTSLITALANDYGFDEVFAHQIKTLGKKGDVLIAMTTSRSPSIVKAIVEAEKLGLVVVVICSERSGDFGVDYTFIMKGGDTAEVQDRAMEFLHGVAYEVKRRLKQGVA